MSHGARLLLALLVAALVLGVVAPVLAQDYENIYLAGGLIARLRDPGKFPSLADRAAIVEKALVEVLSSQDTMHPDVTVKQEAGGWAVYSGPLRVLTVLPKDAQANGLPARQLAAIWAKNLKERLPLATPVSRMGAAAPGAAPPATTPSGGAPAATAPAATAPAATPPTATTPVLPLPAATVPAATPALSLTAALAVVMDDYNRARGLSEADYLATRDRMASDLLTRLRSVLGGSAPLPVGPATTRPPTVVTPPVTPRPPVATTPRPPATTPPPAAAVSKVIPAEWSKLPVNQRVQKKFEIGFPAYQQLTQTDPELAATANNLFAAARAAKAASNWAEAEGYLDGALKLMGFV